MVLKENLGKQFSKMPFPHEDYNDGYAIILYDLYPNQNSHFKTLPLSSTGNVNVELQFGMASTKCPKSCIYQ